MKPVHEATQASYYRQAIALSFCQPNVAGLLLFHAFDETALDRWQSASTTRTARRSRACPWCATRSGTSRGGVIARCAGAAS